MTACADDLQLVEPGKLTWGSSPTFVPFEFMRDGKPAGFDIDLMEDLAKRVGLAFSMIGMEFKGVIPALLGNRIDAGASGLYITAERLQVADFIPYIIVGNQIVVQKGNPKNISGRDSLCGFKVAVPVSTAFEASAKSAAFGISSANSDLEFGRASSECFSATHWRFVTRQREVVVLWWSRLTCYCEDHRSSA
jgi:polar amino acid transport system substrate-binding protein